MEYNYFKYKNQKYVIVYKNDKKIIFKEIDNELVELTSDEYNKIEKYLNQKYGYDYDSDYLKKLIIENDGLDNKHYLLRPLTWLEEVIPVDCRENFYSNLKNLQTILELDLDFSKPKPVNIDNNLTGNYNTKDNILRINSDFLHELWQLSKKNPNPEQFFWNYYNVILLHELTHMASSNYNSSTDISLCGFDVYPTDKEFEKNRGLTEGFTELIALIGTSNVNEFTSGYYIEANIVSQLIQLVGLQPFLQGYFANKGTILIKDELNKIIKNDIKAENLLRSIEINYQIRNLEQEQNVLGNIQRIILEYLEKKCELLLNNNEVKELETLLNNFEALIITSDKLKIIKNNPKNYIGIEECSLKLNDIIEKYKKLYENKAY